MPAPARRKSRRLPRPGSRPSLQSKVVRALCNGTAARHWTVAGSGCHCPAMWPTNLAVWGALALILKGRMAPQSLKLNLVPRTQILGLFGPPRKRVIFGTFNKRQICVFCVFTPNYLSNKLLMLYSCVLFFSSQLHEFQFFRPLAAFWVVWSLRHFGNSAI